MEIIFEIIFTLIIENLFYIIFELLIAFGYESVVNSLKEYKSANKYLGLLGCLLIGSIIGLISYLIYPKHLIAESFYGISLILSPLIAGIVMKKWGEKRILLKKRISILSTFWGGAIFAFGYTLIRFLLIK